MNKIIHLNGVDYSANEVAFPLNIDDKYKGSIVANDSAPLLYGRLYVSANYVGLPPTKLVAKLYSHEVEDVEMKDINIFSDFVGTLDEKNLFFDSLTIDSNFDNENTSVYFRGFELTKHHKTKKLELLPIVNNTPYTPVNNGGGGEVDLSGYALINGAIAEPFNAKDAVLDNEVVPLGQHNNSVAQRALLNGSVNEKFKASPASNGDEVVTLTQMNDALPDDLFYDIYWNNNIQINANGLYSVAYNSSPFANPIGAISNTYSEIISKGNKLMAGHPVPADGTLSKVRFTFRHSSGSAFGLKLGVVKWSRIDGTVYDSNDAASTKRIAQLQLPVYPYLMTANTEFTTVDFDMEAGNLIPLLKGDMMSFYLISDGADSSALTLFNAFITFTFKRT